VNWLTLDELMLIHARVIEQTGGAQGVLNPGGLESALARPFTAFGGIEFFPDLPAKVGALIHGLCQFHPFVDGNKRTALVAGDVCLRLKGFRLVPSDEVEPFFWSLARGERAPEEVAAWLTSHIERWE